MKNICDYALNYQDEEINQINEIDALIFARIAYVHFENILDKIPLRIRDISDYLKTIKLNFRDKKLIEILKNAPRYQNLEIIRCENVLDSDKEEQFLALTIKLPNNDVVISFRGTSKNIIGFKEDLNMSFGTIPSQVDALNYVNTTKNYRKMYLVGHSKGGNLAMYAGLNLGFFKRIKLAKIYNFDGPGFLEIPKNFSKIKDKIINYYPETCIVGRMLSNDSTYYVIRTNTFGIEAHNIYSWMLDDNLLIRGNFTNNSDEFAKTCDTFILNVSEEKRRIIVNYLFELILKGDIKNIKELNLESAKEIITKIPQVSKNEKEELINLMRSFLKAMLPIKKK